MEKTLIVLKPDTVQRQLVGEIIARLERKGLKIVALKMRLKNISHIYVKRLDIISSII